MRVYFSLTILLLVSFGVNAATLPKITGIYSNLTYNQEAGDLIGAEIWIVLGGEHRYFAIMQCAEGYPSKPVVVTATVKGTNVEFSANNDADSNCPKNKFSGIITTDGLRGKFEGTKDYPGFLKRGESYWQ